MYSTDLVNRMSKISGTSSDTYCRLEKLSNSSKFSCATRYSGVCVESCIEFVWFWMSALLKLGLLDKGFLHAKPH